MPESGTKRLLALDVFRGATIAAMMQVNNAGDWGHVYEPLEHAPWNGLTPTDLIFPFFLFIVGVSMTLSYARRVEQGAARSGILNHAAIRMIGIFLIGVFLYAFPRFDFSTMRILGVLQRIAVCYGLATVLFLYFQRKALLWWSAAILCGYWAVMMLVPVPGIGAGVLEPNKNIGAYVDQMFLSGHMWFLTKTWDPEGILSTFPAIVNVLLGILAGYELRSGKSMQETVTRFFFWGVVLSIGGWVWNHWFPVNKNLWTSSYVLVTGGFALIALAVAVYLIDLKQKTWWIRPFTAIGMNALFLYAFTSLLATTLYSINVPWNGGTISLQEAMYQTAFTWIPSPYLASAAFGFCFVLVTWAVAEILYRRKWFVKL